MRKFLKANRGSVVIEFAIVAPIVLYMVLGIMEVSFIMLSQAILESSVRESSRSGITGYTPPGMTRDQYVQQQIEQNMVFLNPDNMDFETRIYPSYQAISPAEPFVDANDNESYDPGETYTDVNSNGQWDDDTGTSGSGSAGDIVVYRVRYEWTLLTPFVGNLLSDDGQMDIRASMVVRNEPF